MMMPTTQRTVLHVFQTLNARAELDAMVARMWPHDVYRQTVAVMGFDPLPDVERQDQDAANVKPWDGNELINPLPL